MVPPPAEDFVFSARDNWCITGSFRDAVRRWATVDLFHDGSNAVVPHEQACNVVAFANPPYSTLEASVGHALGCLRERCDGLLMLLPYEWFRRYVPQLLTDDMEDFLIISVGYLQYINPFKQSADTGCSRQSILLYLSMRGSGTFRFPSEAVAHLKQAFQEGCNPSALQESSANI